MPTETFKPGDRVVWWKQTPGGGYVFPVLSTVLGVTAKRIKSPESKKTKVMIMRSPRAFKEDDAVWKKLIPFRMGLACHATRP